MNDDFLRDTDDQTIEHPKADTPTDETRHPDVTVRVDPAPIAPSPVPAPATTSYYNRSVTMPPPPPPPTRGSPARDRMRKRRVKPRSSGGEWAWVVIAVAMLAVVIVISMSLTLLLRSTTETPEVIPTALVELPTPVDGRIEFPTTLSNVGNGQQVTLDDGRSVILEPWNGTSRFTVLAMGLDRRPGETGLIYRTDTMMLISIDPISKTIGILSIPRDLYVEVPGYGIQRVNTPMVLGELQRPGLGPQLAMQTVQYNLGMRVHDYVAVDFDAVITVIDLVGGIDIDVPYNISDPQYPNMWYGYDPFYIEAGSHHLNGATALKYARTRHAASDFQRAQRQQQVIYAVRDRVLDADMLPSLIVQGPSLLQNLSDNVYTGLTLDQMIQLALYVKDIPDANIHTGVISQEYVMGYTTEQGAAVLIPNRARLGDLMVQVFGPNYSE
jgi:polyisoprenyl-teichoic acid--peptidoglycan teichoic acid transferase